MEVSFHINGQINEVISSDLVQIFFARYFQMVGKRTTIIFLILSYFKLVSYGNGGPGKKKYICWTRCISLGVDFVDE